MIAHAISSMIVRLMGEGLAPLLNLGPDAMFSSATLVPGILGSLIGVGLAFLLPTSKRTFAKPFGEVRRAAPLMPRRFARIHAA